MSNHRGSIRKLWSEAIARGGEPIQQGALVVPRLNKWYARVHRKHLRITGLVDFHPDYPDGASITTSGIQGHLSLERRFLVYTKHSIYELGTPLNPESLSKELGDGSVKSAPGLWSNTNEDDCTTLRHSPCP